MGRRGRRPVRGGLGGAGGSAVRSGGALGVGFGHCGGVSARHGGLSICALRVNRLDFCAHRGFGRGQGERTPGPRPLTKGTRLKETHVRLASVRPVLAVALALNFGVGGGMGVAASPAIGTVMAKGSFRLDNATVRGHATLFEGATIET